MAGFFFAMGPPSVFSAAGLENVGRYDDPAHQPTNNECHSVSSMPLSGASRCSRRQAFGSRAYPLLTFWRSCEGASPIGGESAGLDALAPRSSWPCRAFRRARDAWPAPCAARFACAWPIEDYVLGCRAFGGSYEIPHAPALVAAREKPGRR